MTLRVSGKFKPSFPAINKLFTSHLFLAAEVCVAAFMFHFNASVEAIAVFGSVFVLILFLCDDITPLLSPLMFASMAVLKSYGATFEDFSSLLPLVVFLALGFAFHFIVYRPEKFRAGRQFPSVAFVAFAILMGGAGILKTKDYYGGSTMYYIVGLSVGMALSYLVFVNYTASGALVVQFKKREEGALYLLARVMCYVAALGFLMLLTEAVLPALETIAEGGALWEIQWSNNLSTFMLMAMPFPYMMAAKTRFGVHYFLLGLLTSAVCVMTLSRGGIIFGFIMGIVCAAACIVLCGKGDRIWYLATALIAAALLLLIKYRGADMIQKFIDLLQVSGDEARAKMYLLAVENFNKFPFFGTGLGYRGEFYFPQEIAMYWYHSTPFQVLGSLGALGIAAYSYQLYNRLDVIFERRGALNVFVFLSFLGFELMALVNPGDFCPVPYVMVLIQIITMSELYNTKNYDYEKIAFLKEAKQNFWAYQRLFGGRREGYLVYYLDALELNRFEKMRRAVFTRKPRI